MADAEKTAISLPRALLAWVNDMAKALHTSRSQVIRMALEDYMRRKETEQLRAQLDAAYDDEADEEDRILVSEFMPLQSKVAESDD